MSLHSAFQNEKFWSSSPQSLILKNYVRNGSPLKLRQLVTFSRQPLQSNGNPRQFGIDTKISGLRHSYSLLQTLKKIWSLLWVFQNEKCWSSSASIFNFEKWSKFCYPPKRAFLYFDKKYLQSLVFWSKAVKICKAVSQLWLTP